MFGTGRILDIIDGFQIVGEGIGGLFRIQNDFGCPISGFLVVFLHIESHILVLGHSVSLCGSEIEITLRQHTLCCGEVRTSGLGGLVITQH